ncbi:MAG: hypothetical protein WBL45_03240 [Solirubrobacterales bacterium]
MIGRRIALGLVLLSALVFSAFAASSASAAVAGTTMFTCAKSPEQLPGFTDEHCTKAAKTDKEVKRKHVAVAQDKETIFHGTNEKTSADTTKAEPTILKTSFLGVEVEISCSKVFAHGNITNRLNGAKEHYIHGTKVTILYTGCKYIKPGFCKVKGEKIEITGVTATTEKEGDNVRFKPEAGETLVTFESEGFGCPAKAEIKGTFRAQVEGATLSFTEAGTTADKSLTFAGNAMGISGKITLSQADETQEAGKTGDPLTATTIET